MKCARASEFGQCRCSLANRRRIQVRSQVRRTYCRQRRSALRRLRKIRRVQRRSIAVRMQCANRRRRMRRHVPAHTSRVHAGEHTGPACDIVPCRVRRPGSIDRCIARTRGVVARRLHEARVPLTSTTAFARGASCRFTLCTRKRGRAMASFLERPALQWKRRSNKSHEERIEMAPTNRMG